MNETMEFVEIEVDAQLHSEIEKLIEPLGITIEELITEFIHWCVEKPEKATAYLNQAMENFSLESESL